MAGCYYLVGRIIVAGNSRNSCLSRAARDWSHPYSIKLGHRVPKASFMVSVQHNTLTLCECWCAVNECWYACFSCFANCTQQLQNFSAAILKFCFLHNATTSNRNSSYTVCEVNTPTRSFLTICSPEFIYTQSLNQAKDLQYRKELFGNNKSVRGWEEGLWVYILHVGSGDFFRALSCHLTQEMDKTSNTCKM